MELTEIKTSDGLLLQGISFSEKRKHAAIIYIHGLGGNFHSNPKKVYAFTKECNKNGFGFFTFNNRGSHIITGFKVNGSYAILGRCYEKFEDCIYDINAMIREAKKNGYKKIILVGHSTGANKVVYYLSKKPDRSVCGGILSGPVSDVPTQIKGAGKKYKTLIQKATSMKRRNKGGELMPVGTPSWPISASRFLSLSVPGSVEDVFQYHMKSGKAIYAAMKKINLPVLAILGAKDEYVLTKPKKILKNYSEANPIIETKLVQNATHSFTGKEKLLAKLVCSWAKKFS